MSEAQGALIIRDEETHQDTIDFVVRLARALQRYGIPAHRLEENMEMLNKGLGFKGQFFSSPGTLMASFDADRGQRTYILRAPSGDLNLEKLDRLVGLTGRVAKGVTSPANGAVEVEDIVNAPERWSAWLTILCFMLSSAAPARLFGGGWREILVASLIGLCLGLLIFLAHRIERVGNLLAPLAAIGAAAVAELFLLVLGPYSVQIATVTGLIILIPGLSLTVAMTELATGHPTSGTSRLANSTVLFLMIGFGIALGSQVRKLMPEGLVTAAPVALPDWTQWPALVIAAFTFVVLFRGQPKDTPWIVFSGIFSFLSARIGSQILGPEIGGFIAALLLATASNIFSRLSSRPGAIVQVPGLILLVPGSVGYRGVISLLSHDTIGGLETAFTMFLTAISLVAGLLFANVIFARKRPI